jgi:aryl-alcohol dehydrogenase-like predicted oxidoreductase
MDYVWLGNTGVKVSKLGFGTMLFGTDADEQASAALYGKARDGGINLFDCADVYGSGRSEEILGRLVAPHHDEIVLTTKAYFPTGSDPNARGTSRYHLVRAVEASLRRLGTDRVDLFFLHRWDDATDLDETLRGVEDLVRSGKILYPAVSNFAAWQTAKALERARSLGYAPLVAIQPMYNLLKRTAEIELLPMAKAESLAVFPYSPTAGGLLSGKYGRERRPEFGRVVDNAMYKTRYADRSNFEIAEAFCQRADALGLHPLTLALAWVASHPAVTAPLVGARHPDQLDPAFRALEVKMTPELRDEISALSPAPPPATDRNEETTSFNYGSR